MQVFFWGVMKVTSLFYDYSKHNYMALPIIVMVVAMGCAVAVIEAAAWNAQLDRSHNDTRSSCACVHVERIACDDNTQAETYFK
jgi:hypothetical protein